MQPAEALRELRETPTSRDIQREETRRRLRDAALRVYRKDGLAAAKIDDIARIAAVSRGTFYFHFPTKEDVLVDLLDAAEQRIAAAVSKLPKKATLKKVLETVSAEFAQEWESDVKIFPDVGAVALKRASAPSRAPSSRALYEALVVFFRAAVAKGEFTVLIDPGALVDFYLLSVFAAALAWCAHPKLPLHVSLANATQIFLHGARVPRR